MTDTFELGLDTFGDVTMAADGTLHSAAHVLARRRRRGRARRPGRARTPSASASIIAATLPSRRPRSCSRAIAARTSRILLGSAVTVLSTDDPVRVFQRFSTLDASVERARRSHPRPRIVHRVLSALRLRPRPVRRALRREAESVRGAAEAGPVTWSGSTRAPLSTARRSIRRSRTATLQDLGRRRRQPGIGGPRRALRPAADARHHRRQPAAVPAVRRSLPAGAREARPARPADRRPLARPRCRDRRAGEGRALAALRGHDQPDWRRTRLAAGHTRCNSSAKPARTAPCASVRRRPSRPRSPGPSRLLGLVAFQREVQHRHTAARRR